MQLILFVPMAVLAWGAPSPPPCTGRVSRDDVIRCAMAADPSVDRSEILIEAADARIDGARVILPSNPVVAVSVAGRWGDAGARAFNYYATLSQAVEIGGQRRHRKAVATAERKQSEADLEQAERRAIARALDAYYESLAGQERLLLLERHVATSKAIAEVADARAEAGLIPGIDADIALAEVVRSRASLAREHAAVQQADAQLALLLGGDPLTSEVRATGRLAPLPFEPDVRGSTDMALQTRPELSRVRAEQDQHRQTEALLKRDRLPDPTLSVFVQQDGFGEQVIGGGISFPIPLPAPLGQTDRGRIQESRARARAAQADLAVAQREVRLEVMQAHTQLRAEREALAAHDEALLERAREDLIALAREIEAGRLDVGDALVAQQALIDLLGRHVEAKRRVAVASVRLVQVSGEPFEAGAR